MSEGPQVAPAVSYVASTFESNSTFASVPEGAACLPSPSVLLVGRNGSWGISVLRSLEKLGTGTRFVPPQRITTEYVRSGAYKLVLLDSTVSPDQRRQLASELVGSGVSIFYTFPVENGCWWLPALRRGKDCHGEPAFRRNEFPFELERLLRDQTES